MADATATGTRDAEGVQGEQLVLEGVTKKFGDFTAVDDLDLTVPSGSFFALLGPSGCGKTTTLRMVAGLEEPTAGTIRLGERDIAHDKPYKRPVNTVFQSYALFPHMTIFENVAFGRRRSGVKDVKAQVAETLDEMGVDIIEAGFPIASNGDFEAVVAVAKQVKNATVAGLARAITADIDRAGEAVRHARKGRIHTFVSTSPIHLAHQMKKTARLSSRRRRTRTGCRKLMGRNVRTTETDTTIIAVVALASMTNSVNTTMFQTTGKPEKKYSSVFMPVSA